MAKQHRTIDVARKHLGEAAGGIPTRYKEGVSNAEWEAPASSAQADANYNAGIAEAQAAGRRVSGIHRAGNTGWRAGAMDKGAAVIGTRITAALGKYATNFAPVLSAMNSASDAAPPRGRDAMSNIDSRLKPVVAAAVAAKRK